MRKDFLAYTLLLLVGLGLAYMVSLPRNEKSSTQTEWASVDPKSVTELSFHSDKAEVMLSRVGNGFSAHIEQPDEAAKCDPAKEACEGKRISESFKVNKKIDDILSALNPLYVLRTLGKADKLNLAEFGLKDATGTFSVKAGDKVVIDFTVGKKSYGSRNTFVIDKKSQDVLLLNGDGIEDIEKARSRLFQKELITADFDTITSATIAASASTKDLSHTKRDGAGELMWTEGSGDQSKPIYKNFMGQVEKLVVQRYATDADIKELEAAAPFVAVVLKKGGKELASIKLFKRTVGDSISYWAHSSDLGTYAQINNARAEGLEKDAPALMGK